MWLRSLALCATLPWVAITNPGEEAAACAAPGAGASSASLLAAAGCGDEAEAEEKAWEDEEAAGMRVDLLQTRLVIQRHHRSPSSDSVPVAAALPAAAGAHEAAPAAGGPGVGLVLAAFSPTGVSETIGRPLPESATAATGAGATPLAAGAAGALSVKADLDVRGDVAVGQAVPCPPSAARAGAAAADGKAHQEGVGLVDEAPEGLLDVRRPAPAPRQAEEVLAGGGAAPSAPAAPPLLQPGGGAEKDAPLPTPWLAAYSTLAAGWEGAWPFAIAMVGVASALTALSLLASTQRSCELAKHPGAVNRLVSFGPTGSGFRHALLTRKGGDLRGPGGCVESGADGARTGFPEIDHGRLLSMKGWRKSQDINEDAELQKEVQELPPTLPALCDAEAAGTSTAATLLAIPFDPIVEAADSFDILGGDRQPVFHAAVRKRGSELCTLEVSRPPMRGSALASVCLLQPDGGAEATGYEILAQSGESWGALHPTDLGGYTLRRQGREEEEEEVAALVAVALDGACRLVCQGRTVATATLCATGGVLAGMQHLEVCTCGGTDPVLVLCCILAPLLLRQPPALGATGA